MKILLVIIFIFSFGQFLLADESDYAGLNKKIFSVDLFTDSLQKKDVWAKHYGKKNPVFASFLSSFIPGGGQVYNGQYLKSGLFIGGEILLLSATISTANKTNKNELINSKELSVGFLLGLWFSFRTWSVIDAFVSAKDINDQLEKDKLNGFSYIFYPKEESINLRISLNF
ncbi:MAG: hypothetical protein D8M58_20370 [Calditrichaeota bacterium]|nr:MAG: hypothetical protein DWQ03_14355 [Calditrichota bacterium]MBL1207766.1 hypothetical protein [Calditrichota bacterium]NOG47599.1 hypothetical protein [Calditrichota bacterium]